MSIVSLQAEKLKVGYLKEVVLKDISLDFKQAEIVSIIGPNGSGKSTLLKTLCRLLQPSEGTVYLGGKELNKISSGEIAKLEAILPQGTAAPSDMTIRDLTAYGRIPYQSFLSEISTEDKSAIAEALNFTELTEMQDRRIDTLSGGERQRAWLAMALAQKPRILLLDEPTTYLDIHHQLELMELISRLHKQRGLTIIMVLHDLNHAARYSHRIIAMKKGQIMADGPVKEVFQEAVLEKLYDVKAVVTQLEQHGRSYPICFPYMTTYHF